MIENISSITGIHDSLSEKDKENEAYLTRMTDLTIAELVKEKDAIRKAYNYYDGVLDKEQFLHLEEVYGLRSATSVEFIPLVRPHIDQLVGELLQIPFKPKITCKDEKTLSKINRDKQIKIAQELFNETKQYVNNMFLGQLTQDSQQGGEQSNADPRMLKKLEDLKSELTQSFISEYEIAAQYLIEHFKQTRDLDLLNKRKELFKDLLIAGQCYYDVNVDKIGQLPTFERIHPLDCFIEKNPNSPYLNRSSRAVVRRRLTKQEILIRYGRWLKPDQIEQLGSAVQPILDQSNYYVNNNSTGIIAGVSPTIVGDASRDQLYTSYYNNRYIVYEVQFLSANEYKVDGETHYRIDRYRTIKINDQIYVLLGKDEDVFRSQSYPDDAYLSINGIAYEDSLGKPYSLMIATANIQDKYNILHYHRDNLIALSGVRGSAIESSIIPEWLGDTPEERFKKFISYKKTGNAPLDSQQEGATALNTALFQTYDDSLPGEALQQIQFAIQSTEELCSRITGVFRERLGGIEQKDAVTNVQVGIRQSAIITKQYYQLIDLITKEVLHDLINNCKLTFKKGYMGSIVLGDNLIKIFEIKPDNFNYTDYDIHIDDSGDIVRDMQKIEQLTLELIKAGQQDVDVILSAIGMYSMTQMKFEVQRAVDKKKKESDMINQLQSALDQQQKETQSMQQMIQKLESENKQLKNKDRELEKYRIDKDFEIRKYTVDKGHVIETKEVDLDKKRVELEQLQLLDSNPYNDEIKNG